jgi:CBS domain-containing protein
MKLLARDLMVDEFETIRPEATVQEAIRLMRFTRHEQQGRRIFGLVVLDGRDDLVGMISMSDILHHVRPPFKRMWSETVGLAWSGQFQAACERAKKMRVKEIMNPVVITVEPENTIVEIIDLMTKHHIRRIPVICGRRVCGMVYISDVFNCLHPCLLGGTEENAQH